ncbi:MAG: serine hydrolase, partial [Planctomycetota bacterium]
MLGRKLTLPLRNWICRLVIVGPILASCSGISGTKPWLPGEDRDLLSASPTDPRLQNELEKIDRALRSELGIAEAERACGVLDLQDERLAWIRPDATFYGASVPKICILLAYLEQNSPTDIDAQTKLELELMIKRSDNDLSAKYSRLVGLQNIQNLQRSRKYKLYDEQAGGGLWSGKHYGQSQPRTGDPVHGYSHAANVRQCLRYFLLLEQGKLVSEASSKWIREVFAAPRLDFYNSNFVRGLNGRDALVLRKSGLWEDWHLDAARIEHKGRVYLLAGMTHHAKGGTYL